MDMWLLLSDPCEFASQTRGNMVERLGCSNVCSWDPFLANRFSSQINLVISSKKYVIFIVMTVINGKFEWDSEKDEINKIKHGFSFAEILDVFDDPYYDTRTNS